jgi:SPP1 family predicted phage head-tail adaptor
MTSSRLRHRVSLYRDAASTVNAANEPVESAELVAADLPAEVVELSGRELERARQVQSEVSLKVTLRHNADVTADRWFIYGTRRLDIVAALDPDGRGRWTDAFCVESR